MTEDYRMLADELEQFMKDVFLGLGVPADAAEVCADVLITADRLGIDSHGINRCKPIYFDRIKAGIQDVDAEFEVVRDFKATAVVDGHNGMGHFIGKKCMQMAIDKARDHGIGMVVTRNSTHYGIAGYYPLMAIENGMIGVTGTNARPSIAPTFGVENMLGTNPLTFGMPSDDDFPFLLDCATSVTQRGKIEYYARCGKDVPDGLVIDREGKSMTNAGDILDALVNGAAALVPLGGPGEDNGGYKGFGYAVVVELLSSALQSGNFMKALGGVRDGKKVPIELGHFFIAIDVEAFLPVDEFEKNTGDVLRALRASQKEPGAERIYTPGEKEHLTYLERKEKGVPLPEGVRNDMIAMRDDLGLDYKFKWE